MSKLLETILKTLGSKNPMVIYVGGVLWLTFMTGVHYSQLKRTNELIERLHERSVEVSEVEDMFVGYDRLRTNGPISERMLRAELRDIHTRHFGARRN